MVDYVLKRDENGMVRYLYRNDGKHPYVGKTKIESAEWMLRQGEVVVSEEYDGFAVTANGMYFFEAEVKGEGDRRTGDAAMSDGDGSPSHADVGGGRDAGGKVEAERVDGVTDENRPPLTPPLPSAEIGADGLPLPAGADKPRRKRRIKDVVCE